MSASSRASTGGGGRIIAQNPALLDMLRERTLELQQQQEQAELVQREQSDLDTDRQQDGPLSVREHIEPPRQIAEPVDPQPDYKQPVPELVESKSETPDYKSEPLKQTPESNENTPSYNEQNPPLSGQNKELLQTGSAQVRRYYVDSPAFTREDEDKYTFVNPDIDNESAESVSSRARQADPESVDAMPTVEQLAKATSELIESTTRAQTQASNFGDSNVNIDTDMSQNKVDNPLPYTVHDCKHHQAGYYNKVDPNEHKTDPFDTLNKLAAKRNELGEEHQTRVIEPINHPLQPIPDEQTEELRLLEEEEQYQLQLQQRIHSAKEAGDRFSIPKLDLDEVVSDDDDEKKAKKKQVLRDSLDEPSHRNLADYEAHQLRDSLDPSHSHDPAYAHDDLRDSLEDNQHPSNIPDTYQLQAKYQDLEQRLAQLEADKQAGFTLGLSQGDQRMQQIFDSNRSDTKRMTSSDLKNLQNPDVQHQFSHDYRYIAEEEEYDPNQVPVAQAPPPPVHSNKGSGQYRGNMPLNFGNKEDPTENGYGERPSEQYTEHNENLKPYDPSYREPEVVRSEQPVQHQEPYEQPTQRQYQAQHQQQYEQPPQRQYQAQHQDVPIQYVQQPMPNQQAPPYANGVVAPQQYANERQVYANEPYISEQYTNSVVAPQQYANQPYSSEQYGNEQYANQPYANEQYVDDQQVADAQFDQYGQPIALEQRTPGYKGFRSAPDLSDPQGVDYIELNRRALREEVKSAATYGKLFSKKKVEQKEDVSPVPAARKTKGKPGVNSRAPAQGSGAVKPLQVSAVENGLAQTEHSSPELLWAQRSKHLAKEKDRKVASQQQKSKKLYRKDSRTSSDNQSRVVSSQPAAPRSGQMPQAPQTVYQQPAPHSQPAYQPPAPQWQPAPNQTQPIQHTVYTDDGQRISVDINLKIPEQTVGPYSQIQRNEPVSPYSQGNRHAQQQPAYTIGALTQQNISSQYVQNSKPVVVDNMHIQSITSSASSAGVVDHAGQLRKQFRQAPGAQQYPIPAQPHMQGSPQHFNQYAHGQQSYALPRQPEGVSQVQPQLSPKHPPAPSQDPRFMMQHHAGSRPMHPVKQGYAKHRKPPPAQPMQAFEHYQPQETDQYYESNDIPESSRNISGMSSPTSYRGNGSPSMSPYKVVPPIDSAEREGRGKPGVFTSHPKHSPGNGAADPHAINHPGEGGGSYMDQLKNKKRGVHYKQYTLKDYRNLKTEIRLGGLGPNTESETAKEKREKLQRQLNYARSINDRNRQDYEYVARKPKSRPDSDQQSEEDFMDKRKLALEYAKSVPKPKVNPRHAQDDDQYIDVRQPRYKYVQGTNTNTGKTTTTLRDGQAPHESSNNTSKYATREPSRSDHDRTGGIDFDLQALQERHQADKQKAALIRQNIQGSVAS